MNKKLYALTGAAVAVASTALIFGYAVCKKKEQAVCTGILLAGVAGLLGGALIAYEPKRRAKKQLTVHDLLDEDELMLVKQNIAEVLCGADNAAMEQSFSTAAAEEQI